MPKYWQIDVSWKDIEVIPFVDLNFFDIKIMLDREYVLCREVFGCLSEEDLENGSSMSSALAIFHRKAR